MKITVFARKKKDFWIKTHFYRFLDKNHSLNRRKMSLNSRELPGGEPVERLGNRPLKTERQRFDGVCYRLRDRPQDFPQRLPCSVEKKEEGLQFTVKLDEVRTLRFYRHRSMWMDSESLAQRYQREASASPGSR